MAMNGRALPPPTYVDSPDKLNALVHALAGETLLAIDTESNSLYAYRERVCLIQLSTRAADYIIDPLKIRDLQPLAPLFADPTIEKVFHAAEYDLMCMKRDFSFSFNNLFDTMIAARICGYKMIGLGSLIGESDRGSRRQASPARRLGAAPAAAGQPALRAEGYALSAAAARSFSRGTGAVRPA